jgi:hypothetical protein
MKQYNKLLALAVGACLFEATPSLAAVESAENSQARLESAIQKVNMQTEQLQKEIKQLKAELRQVKQEKRAVPQKNGVDAAQTKGGASKPSSLAKLIAAPVWNISLPDAGSDLDPSAFLSFQSSMSQGMFFLEQQQAWEKQLKNGTLPYEKQPTVILGGKLEALGYGGSSFNGPNSNNIDLATAELEVFAQASSWASAFFAIDYNSAPLNTVLTGSGNTINNSGFYLNRGFITIGNLNKSPIYLSLGQMYAPFGSYSTNMLSNPVTKVLGRAPIRAAQLGYDKDGFNTSVYVFNGAANTGNTTINNWGANAGYQFKVRDVAVGLGTGFINNMADAQGAQLINAPDGTFKGFSQNPSTEQIIHYVPGVDLNLSIAKGPLYFLAEGVGATRQYDVRDMTFNGAGAQPKAAHFETGYNFKLFGKKSIFNVAYEQTWDGLAMGLPKNSYVATLNTSIWKNTVETLEFRHDVNYAATDISTGACSFESGGQKFTVCPGPTSGGSQNTVLAQFGVYF